MSALDYVELIHGRFANPEIRDTTRRVAFDGSSRHQGFLHPIIRDAISKGAALDGLALVEALWARMCIGTREDGSEIEPNDPYWDSLVEVANTAKANPMAWLAQDQFYGDLGQDQRFSDRFAHWLNLIWGQGTKAAIQSYLAT